MGSLIAWAVVAVAGLATLLGIYGLTRGLGSVLVKSLLRSLAAVVFLLPAPVPGYEGRYAPAFIVALFEGLFQRDGDPGPALQLLGAGVLVVLVAVGTWYLVSGRKKKDQQLDADEETSVSA